MSPSGLIFLVIVGIWAAYFTQYWIRRREHLSTARSMDRFSESMRVLARRSPLPESSLAAPAAPSYAVTPARSTRPQILVKRAAVSSAGTMSREQDGDELPTAGSGSPDAGGPSSGAMLASSHRHGGGRGAVGADGPGSRLRPVRAALGLTLLAALVATVVIAALAPFTRLLWWAFVVPLLVAVVAAAGLRAVASVSRRQARAERIASRSRHLGAPAAHRSVDARIPVLHATREADRDASASPTSVSSIDDDAAVGNPIVADQATATTGCDVVHDQDAPVLAVAGASTGDGRSAGGSGLTVVAEVAEAPLVDEDDIPLTWDPVPVPRPTYTMKARAEYPSPPPAQVTPPTVAERCASGDDDVVDPRRAAGA